MEHIQTYRKHRETKNNVKLNNTENTESINNYKNIGNIKTNDINNTIMNTKYNKYANKIMPSTWFGYIH